MSLYLPFPSPSHLFLPYLKITPSTTQLPNKLTKVLATPSLSWSVFLLWSSMVPCSALLSLPTSLAFPSGDLLPPLPYLLLPHLPNPTISCFTCPIYSLRSYPQPHLDHLWMLTYILVPTHLLPGQPSPSYNFHLSLVREFKTCLPPFHHLFYWYLPYLSCYTLPHLLFPALVTLLLFHQLTTWLPTLSMPTYFAFTIGDLPTCPCPTQSWRFHPLTPATPLSWFPSYSPQPSSNLTLPLPLSYTSFWCLLRSLILHQ